MASPPAGQTATSNRFWLQLLERPLEMRRSCVSSARQLGSERRQAAETDKFDPGFADRGRQACAPLRDVLAASVAFSDDRLSFLTAEIKWRQGQLGDKFERRVKALESSLGEIKASLAAPTCGLARPAFGS